MSRALKGLVFALLPGILCGSAGVGCSKAAPVTVVAASSLPSVDSDPHPPTVIALLVGVDGLPEGLARDSGLQALHFAGKDVEQLASDLEFIGLPPRNVARITGASATATTVREAMARLATRAGTDDAVLAYFSCHAADEAASGFSLGLGDGLMTLAEVVELFTRIRASRRLLLLDLCRTDAQKHRGWAFDPPKPEGGGGVAWIAGARGGQAAYEADVLGSSVFAHTLSRILRNPARHDLNGDGALDVEELATPLRDGVLDWARSAGVEQEPEFGPIGSGTMRLIPVPRRWVLEHGEPLHRMHVAVRFRPDEVKPGRSLWIVVSPLEQPGLYYPQGRATIEAIRNGNFELDVYLGDESGNGVGEGFTVSVVEVDKRTDHQLRLPSPMTDPALQQLDVRCHAKVTRKR